MRIAEIYQSRQGEGLLAGTSSVFVRASGCNLRCWFCDTPYASWQPEGEDLSVEEILRQVEQFDNRHVVLTGGEPMLFAELVPLCAALKEAGWHITIETAGTLYLPVECDLMSISPKLANSKPSEATAGAWVDRHEKTRVAPIVIEKLFSEYNYQMKFVVDKPTDCEEVQAYLATFPTIDPERVMLMPQGVDKEHLKDIARWLEPYCEQHDLRFCPRKQIEWFGLVRGT